MYDRLKAMPNCIIFGDKQLEDGVGATGALGRTGAPTTGWAGQVGCAPGWSD